MPPWTQEAPPPSSCPDHPIAHPQRAKIENPQSHRLSTPPYEPLKHPDPDPDHGYPGLAEELARYRSLDLPPCSRCGSSFVKKVETGVIGRTVTLAALTGKIHLVTGTKPGAFHCDHCGGYFDLELIGHDWRQNTVTGTFIDKKSPWERV